MNVANALLDSLLLGWIGHSRLRNWRILHRPACIILAIILIRDGLYGQIGLRSYQAA
jgi:hypothetical protein